MFWTPYHKQYLTTQGFPNGCVIVHRRLWMLTGDSSILNQRRTQCATSITIRHLTGQVLCSFSPIITHQAPWSLCWEGANLTVLPGLRQLPSGQIPSYRLLHLIRLHLYNLLTLVLRAAGAPGLLLPVWDRATPYPLSMTLMFAILLLQGYSLRVEQGRRARTPWLRPY
jgi:hypothetical protein